MPMQSPFPIWGPWAQGLCRQPFMLLFPQNTHTPYSLALQAGPLSQVLTMGLKKRGQGRAMGVRPLGWWVDG